jgi:hypothetical protein
MPPVDGSVAGLVLLALLLALAELMLPPTIAEELVWPPALLPALLLGLTTTLPFMKGCISQW